MGGMLGWYDRLLGKQSVAFPVKRHGLIAGADKRFLTIRKDAVEADTKSTDLCLVRVAFSNTLEASPVRRGEGLAIVLYN
jgi:hypothetical protein